MFFENLELHEGLDCDSDAHIWLIHHLYLSVINEDALEWADAWNHHKISIRGERQWSPCDMFFFGMLQNGPQGVQLLDDEEPVEDIQSYGIDWEDYNNDNILNHHRHANHDDNPDDNPFMSHRLERMTQVDVDEPGCPLMEEQITFLNLELNRLPYMHSSVIMDFSITDL